ncbi:uncharacterized protein LOC134310015 [Trichomycterus rosablanca]
MEEHFSPLFRDCFKDSVTAQHYKCASTKTTCMINEAVAPHFREELVTKMKTNPFTLIIDGSNDTGREKMNPLTVRVFDGKAVVHRQRFLEVTGFDPEDLAVDVGHWFRGSTNRKEFCELHEYDYMEILQRISIRWLSLERCLTRILQQYEPLTSYFKSSNEKQPRFRRLVDAFCNPLTEVYLLFYHATLPAFSFRERNPQSSFSMKR